MPLIISLLLSSLVDLSSSWSRGCIDLGNTCWSWSQGLAQGQCCEGLQCQPWLPSGGSWNEKTPWFCLHTQALADGSPCNYVQHTRTNSEWNCFQIQDTFEGLCAGGHCVNGKCSSTPECGTTTTSTTGHIWVNFKNFQKLIKVFRDCCGWW